MNERQKKILADAFLLLKGMARRGKARIDEGAGIPEMREHVDSIATLANGMKEALDNATGAGNVLDMATARGRRTT